MRLIRTTTYSLDHFRIEFNGFFLDFFLEEIENLEMFESSDPMFNVLCSDFSAELRCS